MPKYGTVVTDAGPLISLEKIPEGFSLLQYVCSRLLVPEAVLNEVSVTFGEGCDYLSDHRIREVIDVQVVEGQESPLDENLREDFATLGAGEKSALALARWHSAPILVEERRARGLAHAIGLTRFGAAAVIKIAYEEEGISRQHAESCLRRLLFVNRINRKVFDRVLEALST